MRFDAVTLFPEMFDAVLDYGITRRALDRGLYRFKAWPLLATWAGRSVRWIETDRADLAPTR